MKPTILTSILVAFVLQAHAEELPYQTALNAARERLNTLNAEMHDYRKVKPELPPAQQEERLRLLGQLVADDPIWILSEQLQADISALAAIRSRTPADDATLDSLKDLLAITGGLQDRATSQKQAQQLATALRQFIARRDATGASTWAKSQ